MADVKAWAKRGTPEHTANYHAYEAAAGRAAEATRDALDGMNRRQAKDLPRAIGLQELALAAAEKIGEKDWINLHRAKLATLRAKKL
jgi:hypothetical protein